MQTKLGHKDPALTLRLYQHLFPDDLEALGERMDEAHRAAMSKIARPGDGLEIVRRNKMNKEIASTWSDVAPPARFERATHGLVTCGLAHRQARSDQRLSDLTCNYSYTILCQ